MDRSLQWHRSSESVDRIKEGSGTLAGSLIARIEKILSEQPAGGISGTWVWNPIWSGVEIWPFSNLIHLKRPWCWERLKAGGEGDDRGWDGWIVSPTQWAWVWVWVNSGSWWWTGRPGLLQSLGSQRVGHNWATELTEIWPLAGLEDVWCLLSTFPELLWLVVAY